MAEEKTVLPSHENAEDVEFRRIVGRIVVVGTFILVPLLFFGLVAVQFGQGYWLTISLNHFPAVIGLPGAAVAAMIIVLIFRNVEGPIEFKVLGLAFSGASGPVILWVFCFLAIVVAIRLLWPLATTWT